MASGTRATWVVPLAICCFLVALFLIAATIVLGLIPVYLSTKNVNANTTTTRDTINARYATDAADGRSLTLTNTNSVSSQLIQNAGVSGSILSFQSGGFAAATASNGKKRQALTGLTCERATTLSGDIFVTQYQLNYPSSCSSTNCQQRYRTNVQNAVRGNYQTNKISMNFTTGETRTVLLVFCGFYSTNSEECTTATRNNIFPLKNADLYQFNPITYNLTQIGTINCSTRASISSIAVQRNGLFWVLLSDARLYTYNVTTSQCTEAVFVQNQTTLGYTSIVFVKSETNNSETLYVSNDNVLLKINFDTLTVPVVGTYISDSRAALSGTNDGRLFGLFLDSPFIIRQISKTNAQFLAQYSLPLTFADNNLRSFAYFPYNSKFYLVAGYVDYTVISLFDPSTNTNTNQTSLPEVGFYRGAASTCLGT